MLIIRSLPMPKGIFVGKGVHWWDVMLGKSKKGKQISFVVLKDFHH
jgi:hypothetical protein